MLALAPYIKLSNAKLRTIAAIVLTTSAPLSTAETSGRSISGINAVRSKTTWAGFIVLSICLLLDRLSCWDTPDHKDCDVARVGNPQRLHYHARSTLSPACLSQAPRRLGSNHEGSVPMATPREPN